MSFEDAIDVAGSAVEGIGVAILVVGTLGALLRYLYTLALRTATIESYRTVRRNLGRAILLGLEFLVAADIIRTVAVSPRFESVAALAIVVLIRTFLSAALEVEIEGQWPWRRKEAEARTGKVNPTAED